MKSYKVVVSDLDGTLLNGKKEISEENLLAIREMAERGVHFVASSGRCLSEFPKEILAIPEIKYVSCSDGAVIYKKEDGTPIVKNYMPPEVATACADIIADYDTMTLLHKKGELYIDRDKNNHEKHIYFNAPYAFEYVASLVGIETDSTLDEARGNSFVELFCPFFRYEKELLECVERLRALGNVKIAASEKYNIEVFYESAGKGRALYPLAEFLGCDISEIIAVGDSKNDIEMVEQAGLGLAMSNAMAELKETADCIICSNEEHSAKYILENYIK